MNILHGITHQLDLNVKHNIDTLKEKRHFNQVDWHSLKDSIRLKDIKHKLHRYKRLIVDEDEHTHHTLHDGHHGHLSALSKKIEQAVN